MKAGGAKPAPVEEKKPRRRVKKVKGHGGHHGGAWKVAYADFVTAMMALFLVLWLVSQADTKLKESIANYFRSPGVFTASKGGVLPRSTKMSKDPAAMDNEDLLAAAANVLNKKFDRNPQLQNLRDQVRIEITDEGLRIQILDKANQVSFNSGSASLNAGAALILKEIALAICDLPNPIFIGGHTDRYVFPTGSSYTNWELSADRANAARRALEASCVKPEQIRRVIGYADTELLMPDKPYDPANRRISITVSRIIPKDARPITKVLGGSKLAAEPDEDGPAKGAQDKAKDAEHGSDHDAETGAAPAGKGAASKEAPTQEPHGKETSGKEAHGKGAHATPPTPVVGKDAPANKEPKESKESRERRASETKLRTDGAVSVGAPDQLPAGIKRTKVR